jgi:hypothetical protein
MNVSRTPFVDFQNGSSVVVYLGIQPKQMRTRPSAHKHALNLIQSTMKRSTSSKKQPPRSMYDGKIAASRNLLKCGRVLKSITNIVSRVVDDQKQGNKRRVAKGLKLVQQVTAKLADEVHHNAKAASNISGVALDYTARTLEVQERRRMSLSGIRDDADIKLHVTSTFIHQKSLHSVPLKRIDSRNKRKIEYAEPDGRGKKKKPELVYPLPENRKEYLPREAASYLGSLRDKKKRHATMQDWISKRLVPGKSKQTLYNLIKKFQEGADIQSAWGRTGRPRLVATEDLPVERFHLLSSRDTNKVRYRNKHSWGIH